MIEHNLKARLSALDADLYNLMRKTVLEVAGVSPRPWQSMLNGSLPKEPLLGAMMKVLGVNYSQLIYQPDYPFSPITVLQNIATIRKELESVS